MMDGVYYDGGGNLLGIETEKPKFDYIKREDALKESCKLCGKAYPYCEIVEGCRAIRSIKEIPAVKPKQGEWMSDKCSVCGSERAWYGNNPPYCPDCGARMEGADDE